MRFKLIVVAVLAALVVPAVALSVSGDQGRRLAGPFCIGKRSLKPLGTKIDARRAVLRAGVVRSVSANQACRPWENRKLGLAWSGPGGLAGAPGAPGAAGAAGAQGPRGLQGERGERGDRGPKGDTGAKGDKGDKGEPGTINGKTQILCISEGGNVKTEHCDPGHGTEIEVFVK
jgi:hypothetical protein